MGSRQGAAESGRHLPQVTATVITIKAQIFQLEARWCPCCKLCCFSACSSCPRQALWAVPQEVRRRRGDSTGWRLRHEHAPALLRNILIREKRSTSSPELPTGHYLSPVMPNDFLFLYCILSPLFKQILINTERIDATFLQEHTTLPSGQTCSKIAGVLNVGKCRKTHNYIFKIRFNSDMLNFPNNQWFTDTDTLAEIRFFWHVCTWGIGLQKHWPLPLNLSTLNMNNAQKKSQPSVVSYKQLLLSVLVFNR